MMWATVPLRLPTHLDSFMSGFSQHTGGAGGGVRAPADHRSVRPTYEDCGYLGRTAFDSVRRVSCVTALICRSYPFGVVVW